MTALMLQRDADRARRLIPGMNDEQSVRTLHKYLAELEAELSAIETPGFTESYPERRQGSRLETDRPDQPGRTADDGSSGK